MRDVDLCRAVEEILADKADADLGSAIYKQRVARQGGGKSGGFRTIIVFRYGSVAFFVHGFAKKDAANISSEDLQEFRKLARSLLALDQPAINYAIREGKLIEVICDEKTI
jgi:hypothetical protein